jgi:hypothetical protein
MNSADWLSREEYNFLAHNTVYIGRIWAIFRRKESTVCELTSSIPLSSKEMFWICESHNDGYEEYYFLGYNAS